VTPGWVARAAGGEIRKAAPATWGFRHETWLVERGDGDRLVLQRRTDGSDPTVAPHPAIRAAVRAVGLPVPEPVRLARDAGTVIVRLPYVEGETAAAALRHGKGAGLAGRACGTVAARLQTVRPDGLGLVRADVAAADHGADLPQAIPPALREPLARYLARTRPILEAAAPAVAHGDLAPVNVIVRHGRVAAVLDLDRVRLAHPAYDAAWFAWVVSAHHPGLAADAWHGYADAARFGGRGPRDLAWLWPLQLLERVREASDPDDRSRWVERLGAALEGRAQA
jgi:aminoglycoside phosphotransferase (APT) family kinase protein